MQEVLPIKKAFYQNMFFVCKEKFWTIVRKSYQVICRQAYGVVHEMECDSFCYFIEKGYAQNMYGSIVCYETDDVQICRAMDDEIAVITEEITNMKEKENWRECLSSIALFAEQAGFEIGVRYIMKLFDMS